MNHQLDELSNTASKLIQFGREQLAQQDIAYQEALLLLSYASGTQKEKLLAFPETVIDDQSITHYKDYIQRRLNHEPIAYITEHKEFWSLPLHIKKGVLIPRPETELLVEIVLQQFTPQVNLNILDLGTGSGCIALAIAKHLPSAYVTACDISSTSLDIATHNAKELNINNIKFIESDWFTKLPAQNYHCIISNPPYIASEDQDIESDVIKHEPHDALFAKQQGLSALQHIIENAMSYLHHDGLLLVEHGRQQATAVTQLFNQHGYQNVQAYEDLQGHTRASSGVFHKSKG